MHSRQCRTRFSIFPPIPGAHHWEDKPELGGAAALASATTGVAGVALFVMTSCPWRRKGSHQRTQPFSLFDCLRGPFSIRVVAVLRAAWSTGAKTAVQPATCSAF